MRRPVMSVSESTATLAPGRMNPRDNGATTTSEPGEPAAAACTGVCTPSPARAPDTLAAPGPVAAHRVTVYPWPTRRDTPAASRSGSPATCSKRRTASVGTAGPSGTEGMAVTPAGQSRSNRSNSTCSRGKPCSSASPAPHVAASVSARAASSSRSCTARSRMRRGSTRTTCAPAGRRSGSTRSPSSRNGSHDSMPSNCSPRASRSHTAVPQGRPVTSVEAAARSSGEVTNSRHP